MRDDFVAPSASEKSHNKLTTGIYRVGLSVCSWQIMNIYAAKSCRVRSASLRARADVINIDFSFFAKTRAQSGIAAGAVQRGGGKGPRPPSKNSASLWPPMKFMIKHNLPLVRGGSLCQYRSVPPSCNYGHPTGPQNVNPRTATA